MLVNKGGSAGMISATLACLSLAACGGGGEGDPHAYKEAVAGQGSTVVSAETPANQATIRYAHYRASAAANAAPAAVNATVNFNASSKAGSIQLPLPEGTELVSTTNGYTTVSWAGPLASGAYRFNGNLLMGCNPAAPALEASQVFASTSLERVEDAKPLDALRGLTFDLVDCALLQQAKVETLRINVDGTMSLSITPTAASENQAINMLNPEKWGGALIDGSYFGGHAFRYGKDGANRYAIVLQKRTMTGAGSVYHYFLAVQR